MLLTGDVLWAEPACPLSTGCHLRGQDPERCEARRPPRRATDEVRVGDQPQGCQGPGAHDSSEHSLSGRRGDPMKAIALLGMLAFVILTAPLAATAQPRGKIPR